MSHPSALQLVSGDGCAIDRQIFSDPGVYEREQHRVFARNWLYLCHESQLQKAGDYQAAWMGETPVIAARGEDGKIHVNINSCSHRGLPVCRHDAGNARRFVCPYHGWSYSVTGELITVPQEQGTKKATDKKRLGLCRVPRIAVYGGLIFGCLDQQAPSLEDYLGDMRFYLDAFLNRFPQGLEIGGPVHKWSLRANWKLPMENQLGDVGHALYLHNTLIGDSEAMREVEKYALTMTTAGGHAAAVRYFPEGTAAEQYAWGMEVVDSRNDSELREYLLEIQQGADQRLLSEQARIKGLTCGIYPNLALILSNATLRVSHPRGPGEIEYWCWWLAPKGAPDSLRRKLRQNYIFFFGPGGSLEQEDSEAWTQQYLGSCIHAAHGRNYFYGLGAGEEYTHPDLPGTAGNCYNEHFARNFYLRWRMDMSDQGDQGEREHRESA